MYYMCQGLVIENFKVFAILLHHVDLSVQMHILILESQYSDSVLTPVLGNNAV